MSEKEKKKFKISKRILSIPGFRKSKKLVRISEEPGGLDESKAGECEISCIEDSTAGATGHLEAEVDLETGSSLTSTNCATRKSRVSSSSLEGVEGHAAVGAHSSSGLRHYEMNSSFCVSTDSGIDCSVLGLDKAGSPERFQAFTRREAERKRLEHLNESNAAQEADPDSVTQSLPDTGPEVKNLDLIAELEEKLSVKLRRNKSESSEQKDLDTTAATGGVETDSPLASEQTEPHVDNNTSQCKKIETVVKSSSGEGKGSMNNSVMAGSSQGDVEDYFLDMYANKTDEAKSKEARLERENWGYAVQLDSSHMVVSPVPQMPVTSQAEHKALPSTPSPTRLYVNDKSAFARYRSLRRSMSDVGKGILGRFRHKKPSLDVSHDDGHLQAVGQVKEKQRRKAGKSQHGKKASSKKKHNVTIAWDDSAFCADADESKGKFDRANQSLSDASKTRSVTYLPAYKDKKGRSDCNKTSDGSSYRSPIIKETITYEVCMGDMSPRGTETIQDLTSSICDMTSALVGGSRHNSDESIKCICDCKDREKNEFCCEKRRSQSLEGLKIFEDHELLNGSGDKVAVNVNDNSRCDSPLKRDRETDTSSSSLDSADYSYMFCEDSQDTESESDGEYLGFNSTGIDNYSVSEETTSSSSDSEEMLSGENRPDRGIKDKSFSVSFENLDLENMYSEQKSLSRYPDNYAHSSPSNCDTSYSNSHHRNSDSRVRSEYMTHDTKGCLPNSEFSHQIPRPVYRDSGSDILNVKLSQQNNRTRNIGKNRPRNNSSFSLENQGQVAHDESFSRNDARFSVHNRSLLRQEESFRIDNARVSHKSKRAVNPDERSSFNNASFTRQSERITNGNHSFSTQDVSLSQQNSSFMQPEDVRRFRRKDLSFDYQVRSSGDGSPGMQLGNHGNRSRMVSKSSSALNTSMSSSQNRSFCEQDLTQGSTPPLDLSMRKGSASGSERKPAFWMDRHVGQVYSPAKRALHKNSGLSESDLCKQILDLYVSDADGQDIEPEFEQSLVESPSFSVEETDYGGINAEDSMLQYGTYIAPRVHKETNVDDFQSMNVPAWYSAEAKTRRLQANQTTHFLGGEDRRKAALEELRQSKALDELRTAQVQMERKRDENAQDSRKSRERQDQKDRHSSSRKHRSRSVPESGSPRSKRQTETAVVVKKELLDTEQESRRARESTKSSRTGRRSRIVLKDKTNTSLAPERPVERPKSMSALDTKKRAASSDRRTEKENLDSSGSASDKSFDKLTYLHTWRNGQRKVRCLSSNEAFSMVKHYPPPKEASRISWHEKLCREEAKHHTPRKTPVKTKPILNKDQNHKFPYDEETPSPIVLTKVRKSKSFSQKKKYKNWPW